MQKKHYSIILMFALILGTLMAALPPVQAQDVRFYVEDPADGDHIYPPTAPPGIPPIPNLRVHVLIECPYAWYGTPDGIVAYSVSVRVNPAILEVFGIEISEDAFWPDGFSDGLLEMFAAMVGGSTLQAPEGVDKATGTMWGFGNALVGVDPAVVGGAGGNAFYGGDVAGLCTLTFKSKSGTYNNPSLIDLFGPGVSTEQLVQGIEVSCKYTTAAGDTVVVEPEDGYYVAEVDTMYLDCSVGYDPASPLFTDWHELAPVHCRWWTLESWEDNGDGVLSESDQVDMTCIDTGFYGWYHVEWVNPAPVPCDGLADLIVTYKEPVPEFPLGAAVEVGLIVAVAYIWWTRRRRLKEVL